MNVDNEAHKNEITANTMAINNFAEETQQSEK